jgi:integrase
MNRVRVRKREDGRYYYDIWYQGKRYRRITNLSRAETEKAGYLRLKELEKNGLGILESGLPKLILFEDFAKDFLETHSKINKRSWRTDEYLLANLKAFFKNTYLSNIGAEIVERYKAQRIKQVSPATVNREIALIKTMLNKAAAWGRIPSNPISGRVVGKLKEKNARERILSPEETGRLIEVASPNLKPILTIALNTGMRRNEILSLKWENVNLSAGYIFIEDSKSGRSRKVPMNRLIIDSFMGLPKRNQLVFYNPETKGSFKDIKTSFKSACRRANIKGLRLHDLRHTFATRYIEAGGDIASLSKILGHAKIQMTMRYCNPTPEHMRLGIERIGELFEKSIGIGNNLDTRAEEVPIKSPASHLHVYN